MELLELISALRPLLEEKRIDQVARVLSAHADMAEVEVARALAAEALRPTLERDARSLDPRERLAALSVVADVFPRSSAAAFVRRLVKDPDARVRSAAKAARRRLGLWRETALPDSRFPPPECMGPLAEGGWNPSGWCFGLDQRRRFWRPPGKPSRPIPDANALAALLEVESPEALRCLLRPGSGPGAPYVAFEIPKRSGGIRTIHAPRAPLKRVQRIILREILAPLPVHRDCHGFVAGRSTVTNARPHLRAALVVKTDLRDFFPSLHYYRVRGFFLQMGYAPAVADLLAGLTTHCPVLPDGRAAFPGFVPQGAPTSPALANLICRRLDRRLAGLARRVGATYTRYADDLTFSFAQEPGRGLGRFFWWVDQICQQEGFAEHPGKRRVMRKGGQQRVTGLVVNCDLSVPRADRRRFRAMLHNARKLGPATRAELASRLTGFAAYVAMVQPERGRRLLAEVRALVEKP